MTRQLRVSALVMCMGVLAALDLRAQGIGVVYFNSGGAPDSKKIRDCTGEFASGTAYRVALYWGFQTETDERNLVQIGASTTFLTGANAGTYFGGTRSITTPGSTVNGPILAFQVRGWNSAAGATYEEAMANSIGIGGKGRIFTLQTRDPFNPLQTPPYVYNAAGYSGFTIGETGCPIIPEPSTLSLGLLGVGTCFLLFRPRHRPSSL